MDAPNDLPLTKVDSQGAPISVIAACIERFRYQAPTPSSARSQIPAGKFWWLDANQSKNEVEPAPRPIPNNIDRGTADRYRSTSPIYESDDESTSDGDTDLQRMVPKALVQSDIDIYSPLLNRYATDETFSNDTTHQDLKAAFNLDSYAEKLLLKCDLLLKGYDKPKDQKLFDVTTGRQISGIDIRGYDARFDKIERSKASSSSGKRQGQVTLSQETLSEEESISLNKMELSMDGHYSSSNRKHAPVEFQRPSHSLNLSDSIDSLPMSPLGLSLAFSADSWSGLHMEGVTAHALAEKEKPYHLAIEKAAIRSERDADDDVERRVITGTDRAGVPHFASINTPEESELARGSGQPIRRASLETIDECSNDFSSCNDDGFEPNLSESVSFPSFPTASQAEASKHRADSLLYVSSSSEGDFISKARGVHAGRHWGGISADTNADGASKRDRQGSAIDEEADADADTAQPAEGALRHSASDDDEAASSECSSEDGSDTDESRASNNTREGPARDPSVRDCAVPGATDAPATNTDSQQASSTPTPSGFALHSPSNLNSASSPLSESDVAPYLKDEITALLWTRLCKIREQMAAAHTAGSTR